MPSDIGNARELPAGVQLAAYRVVQEALTNVRKHASAAQVQVVLAWDRAGLAIEVCDDGTTCAVDRRDGFGLIGMRERVEHYSGEVTAGPHPAGGFRVAARLPFEVAP